MSSRGSVELPHRAHHARRSNSSKSSRGRGPGSVDTDLESLRSSVGRDSGQESTASRREAAAECRKKVVPESGGIRWGDVLKDMMTMDCFGREDWQQVVTASLDMDGPGGFPALMQAREQALNALDQKYGILGCPSYAQAVRSTHLKLEAMAKARAAAAGTRL